MWLASPEDKWQNPINCFLIAVWMYESRRGAFRVTFGVQRSALMQASGPPWLEETGFEVNREGWLAEPSS